MLTVSEYSQIHDVQL